MTTPHKSLTAFMNAQFGNLFKLAFWWTALAPLTFALLNTTEAVGVGRIVYNAALCLMSPIGGIVAERVAPKRVLYGALITRFVLWCLVIPGAWFLFGTSLISHNHAALYIILCFVLACDGVTVALSTVLDIDLAGIDIMSGYYGLDVTDEVRNFFNTRAEFFFACCFIVLTPAMAFIGVGVKHAFTQVHSHDFTAGDLEAGTLVALFAGTFLLGSIVQVFFLRRIPNKPSGGNSEQTPLVDAMNATEEEQPSLSTQVCAVPGDLMVAMGLIWANKPIMFRLIFLGLEIAVEDAMIVVVASQCGLVLPWLGNGDAVNGNVWTAVAVAVGKLGGALASIYMMKRFTPPQTAVQFTYLFGFVFMSSACSFLIPVAVHFESTLTPDGSRALYLVSFFLFFFLSTMPKLGFMCLLQNMVSQVDNGARIFGFIAIIATTFDAGVIMGLSVVFVKFELLKALWITCSCFAAHGVLEVIFGPTLVLTSAIINTSPPGDAEEGSAPREHPGEYSERSAAVTIPGTTTPCHGTPNNSIVRAQVISQSHSVGTGSVTRKVSNLDATPRNATPRYTPRNSINY